MLEQPDTLAWVDMNSPDESEVAQLGEEFGLHRLAPGIVPVPTLIAGIYGMNFREMPELHWQFGYLYALCLMALSGAVLWWRFRHTGWL